LVDYYLTSGQDFSDILRTVDSEKIFSTLLSSVASENDEDMGKSMKERIQEEADDQDGFNEKLLKTMCLNQAIGKLQKELMTLVSTRD
jgi:hypothetical protein